MEKYSKDLLDCRQTRMARRVERELGVPLEDITQSMAYEDWRLLKTWRFLINSQRRCAVPNYHGSGKWCTAYVGMEYEFGWANLNSLRWILSDAGLPFDLGQQCSMDRIDNNRGYLLGNIRWATLQEQMANSRMNGYKKYR